MPTMPETCNFIKKDALVQMFSCEFCDFFFFLNFQIEHLWWLLLNIINKKNLKTFAFFKNNLIFYSNTIFIANQLIKQSRGPSGDFKKIQASLGKFHYTQPKQSFADVLQNRSSLKFRNIHRKTSVFIVSSPPKIREGGLFLKFGQREGS